MAGAEHGAVRIEPWGAGDLPLLTRLLGDPAMMVHLGGPESAEKLASRQKQYENLGASGTGRMFKIVDEMSGEAVGSVGYWEHEWDAEMAYETGWSVLIPFQGRGIAAQETALALDTARADGKYRYVDAFPGVENAASNAICRKLGFTLLGEHEYEYPPGHQMRCNNRRFDLRPERDATP